MTIRGIGSYLLLLYSSACILSRDAVGVLENVKSGITMIINNGRNINEDNWSCGRSHIIIKNIGMCRFPVDAGTDRNFPVLGRNGERKAVIWLDTAAPTQKPNTA